MNRSQYIKAMEIYGQIKEDIEYHLTWFDLHHAEDKKYTYGKAFYNWLHYWEQVDKILNGED